MFNAPKKGNLPTFKRQTPCLLDEKYKNKTSNLHQKKAMSHVVFQP